jgi:outer membrane protein assembly factor BamB
VPRSAVWNASFLALVLTGCANTPTSSLGTPRADAAQTTRAQPSEEPGRTSASLLLRKPVLYAAPTAWPQASGDAGRTSPSIAAGPQTATVRWRRRLEGAVVPGAVVGIDGSVLQASNGGVLHALDPATGGDRWTFNGGTSYGSDLSTSPAVLADGTVLWPGPRDTLYALSSTGKELWHEKRGGLVLSPAVVGGNRVYVADQSGGLAAYDVGARGQHHRAWELSSGGTSYASPSVGPDGTVYIESDRTVIAVADHGPSSEIRWRYTAKDTLETSTAVGPDGTVVVGTNADDEIGLHPDGSVAWRYPKGDYSYSSPVVHHGKAYFGDHLGFLDVADASSGAPIQRDLGIPKAQGTSPDGTGVWTSPLIDGRGDVYFGTAAGHVYGYGPDGRRLWDLITGSIADSYPSLTSNGTLIVGDSDGTVYAIRT